MNSMRKRTKLTKSQFHSIADSLLCIVEEVVELMKCDVPTAYQITRDVLCDLLVFEGQNRLLSSAAATGSILSQSRVRLTCAP